MMADDLETVAADALAALTARLAEALDGPPSLHELTQVVAWALETLSADVAPEPVPPVVVRARVRRGVTPADAADSRAHDLDDSVLVDAGDLLAGVAREVRAAEGEPPSVTDLLVLLGRALRDGRVQLADVGPADVTGLTLAAVKAAKRAERGDILAIPAAAGGYHLAVALDRNVFGTALGLFEGTHPPRPVSAQRHPEVDPRPVYVGEEAVASGRWRIVGRDEELPRLWTSTPEIYHRPEPDLPALGVGPFGAAETPDGTLRQLTEREADEIGLFTPGFAQNYPGTRLEQRLDARGG